MSRVPPSSPETSRRMAKVRQKGTDAEIALRRELYRGGLRYRIDYEVMTKPRRVADVAFPGLRIAIFVDGCFWHGCPEHATWPKQNAEFWRQKIEANRHRDAQSLAHLGIQRKLDAAWLDNLRTAFELIEIEYESYHYYQKCGHCFGDGCNKCDDGYIVV